MKQWEIYSPMDMATAVATAEQWVRRTSAFRMGFRMTNPLSQNTGMDTIHPMINTARLVLFFPTRRTTQSAIFRAAPVFSSRVPIKAPMMITIPMLVNVPANPALTTSAIPNTFPCFTRGIPPIRPKITETPRIARKGWIRNFEMATIIMMMAITNAKIKGKPVIFHTSLHKYFDCGLLICS